jgi:MFS transporter, SP family, arabinose:H+ symporter
MPETNSICTRSAMRSNGSNRLLILSAITAAMGGLLFGFDTAVISGVTRAVTALYDLSPLRLGLTVSSALVGTVLGAMFASAPADRWGRKRTLFVLAFLYLVSALGCAFAWNWPVLVIFRIVGGVGIGGSSVVGPMYIAEISPAEKRGRLVGLFQFNICTGILLAYCSNYLIGVIVSGQLEWRWKLGVSAIPALLFGILVVSIPESPRWLVSKERESEALNVLDRIGERNSQEVLSQMIKTKKLDACQSHSRLWSKAHAFPIFLAISLGIFNQLSGINAILYYIDDIFVQAGFDKVSSNLQAIAVGATNLLFTVAAMSVIDKLGRKTLLLIGAVGTAICLAGVSVIFTYGTHKNFLVWLLMAFIALFSFSQGAVIWVYLNEIFPNNVRAGGASLGSLTHWLMNALISGVYPMLAARSGGKPFAFFAAMMVLQFVVVLYFYPETKAVTLEEVQSKIAKG